MRALLTVIDLLPEREELVLLDELMKALFSFIASSEYLQLLGTYLPRDKDGYDQICADLNQLQSERNRKSEHGPHVALEEEIHGFLFTLECNEFGKFFKACVQGVVESSFRGKKGCCLMKNLESFWEKWVELQEKPNVKYPQWTKGKRIEVTAYQLSDIFYQLWSYCIVKCMGSAMEMLPQPTMELLGFRAGELIIQGRFSHDQLIESFVEADGTVTIIPGLHYSTCEGERIKWSSKVNGHVIRFLHHKVDANSVYLLASTALLSFVDEDSSKAVNEFLQQNHDTDNLLIVYSWLSFHCMLIEWSISTDSRSKMTIDKTNGVACLSKKHLRFVFGNRSKLLACLSAILPGTIEWIVRSGQEQEGSDVLTFSYFNNRIADMLRRPLIVNDYVSVGCKVSVYKPITTQFHSSKTSRIASCISQVILIQLLYTPTKKADLTKLSELLEGLFQLDFPELGILDTSDDKQRGFGANIFRELLDGVVVKADILEYCLEKLSDAVHEGRVDEFFLLHSESDSQGEESIESDSDDSETFMPNPTTATGEPAAEAEAEAANKTGSDENHNENNGNGDETSLKRQSEDHSGTSAPPRKKAKARSNSGKPQQNSMKAPIIELISFVMSGRKIKVSKAEIECFLTRLGATISDDLKEFIENEADKFQKRLEATIIKTGSNSGVTISKDDSDESDSEAEGSSCGGGGTAEERSSDGMSDSEESAGARSCDEESDSEESSGGGGGTVGARSDATHKAAISSSPEKRGHGGKGIASSPGKGKGKMPMLGNLDSLDDSDSDDKSSPPEKRGHGGKGIASSPGKGKGKMPMLGNLDSLDDSDSDDKSSPPEKRGHGGKGIASSPGKGKGKMPMLGNLDSLDDSDSDDKSSPPEKRGHGGKGIASSPGKGKGKMPMLGNLDSSDDSHADDESSPPEKRFHGKGKGENPSNSDEDSNEKVPWGHQNLFRSHNNRETIDDREILDFITHGLNTEKATDTYAVTTDLLGGNISFLDQLGDQVGGDSSYVEDPV
jgi:hypothetical protein